MHVYFFLGVGIGDGKDLSFEIIINGSVIFKLELANAREGQVRDVESFTQNLFLLFHRHSPCQLKHTLSKNPKLLGLVSVAAIYCTLGIKAFLHMKLWQKAIGGFTVEPQVHFDTSIFRLVTKYDRSSEAVWKEDSFTHEIVSSALKSTSSGT